MALRVVVVMLAASAASEVLVQRRNRRRPLPLWQCKSGSSDRRQQRRGFQKLADSFPRVVDPSAVGVVDTGGSGGGGGRLVSLGSPHTRSYEQ